MNRTPGQRGYVLLLTLLLLAIAGAAMISMGRRNLEGAVEALRAEEELQRRWGMLSCQTTLLPRAEKVLANAEHEGDEPIPIAALECSLAGRTVRLIFADEQAKANVNLLYRRFGRSGTVWAINHILSEQGADLTVRLKPSFGPSAGGHAGARSLPAFGSFDQVFANASDRSVLGPNTLHTSAAGGLTCWGAGQLNFHRARESVLEEVCHPHLEPRQVSRLMDIRSQMPGIGVSAALDRLEITRKRRQVLERLLTDRSSCHSLFVVWESDDRIWYQLAIADRRAKGKTQMSSFSW